MGDPLAEVLRDQGRGIAGALLVTGVTFLYTMETWWLAWELPIGYLLVYAFVGLALVLVTMRNVGFRDDESQRRERSDWGIATDFSQLLLQSFLTAYLVLLLFGIVDLGDNLSTVVRLGLIQIVPLGFGASLANLALGESGGATNETEFPQNIAIFTLGALFVTFPIAPTQEMELIAVYMTWERAPFVVLAALATAHLVLYELGFRGESARTQNRSKRAQWGWTFVIYAIGATVSAGLLFAFGHFLDTTLVEALQQVIVLSFPAAIGASAGEVIL